jgi:hypothetical protein
VTFLEVHQPELLDGVKEILHTCTFHFYVHSIPTFAGTVTDPCASAPCQNSGICTVSGGGYTCDCTSTGFTGPTCETGLCALMSHTIYDVQFVDKPPLNNVHFHQLQNKILPEARDQIVKIKHKEQRRKQLKYELLLNMK